MKQKANVFKFSDPLIFLCTLVFCWDGCDVVLNNEHFSSNIFDEPIFLGTAGHGPERNSGMLSEALVTFSLCSVCKLLWLADLAIFLTFRNSSDSRLTRSSRVVVPTGKSRLNGWLFMRSYNLINRDSGFFHALVFRVLLSPPWVF